MAILLVVPSVVLFTMDVRPAGAARPEFPAVNASSAMPASPYGDPGTGLSFLDHLRIEARVNTFTENRQQDQGLAVDREGRILVAWGSRRQEFGTYGVFAQFLDPLGRALGTEIHVNTTLPGFQGKPSVAFARDGSAWIAWVSSGQDGQYGGIYMRRLVLRRKKDGTGREYTTLVPDGEEIRVNGTTRGDQIEPVIEATRDGSIFAAWVSDHTGNRYAYGRLFDPDGTPLGGEFRLGEGVEFQESLPTLAVLGGNRVVAVWSRSDSRGVPLGIFGRVFKDGSPAGGEFAVSESDLRYDVEPSVDSNGRDRFVVAWMGALADGKGDYRVYVRRFDGEGDPIGDPLCLDDSEEGGYLNGATAAMAPDGRFLVAWNVHHRKEPPLDDHRPERQVSIRGRLFDREGNPVGDKIRLNRTDEGEQDLQVGLNSRHVAWSGLDQVALAWHGSIGGDPHGVGLTLYAPDGLDTEAPPVIKPVAALDCDDFTRQANTPPERNAEWPDKARLPMLPPAGPDFGFEAFQSTAWNPPDPELAVGPDYIVGVVNIWIRFFDKSGNIFLDQDLADFFGSTSFSFDPVAMYDPLVDRYVVASAEQDPNGRDFLNIAISDDSDPNGTWYTYRFDIQSYCDGVDFPNLGSGPDAYFIATDCFGWPGGNHIHIFEKAPMLNGDPVTIQNIQTASYFISLGSSKTYDANAPAAYFASAHAAGSPDIRIYAVTDATGTPQLHSVDVYVGPFYQPPDAQQQGTSNRADTIDYRIKNGVVRDGYLYVCHNVGGGDGAAKSRWYKIDLRGWPTSGQDPVKVDGGDIDPGYNIDTWFGDVNVDAQGNMAIAVNRSSPNEFIGVYRTFRLETDPPGVTRPVVEMQTSTTPEEGSRWGDYGALEEDPAEPGSFWNHHEYRTSSWRTWMGHFAVDPNIVLTNKTALIPGSTATFSVTNVAPGERVWFLYSLTGEGAGPSVPRLGGMNLDLLEPVEILGTADGDDTGAATLNALVPPSAPPVQVWFQAVIPRGTGGANSVKSNVTTDTIQ
jgi:hypothetical protein